MEEKSCGAVIFRGGGEGTKRAYLILRYGWGHWGFVKGHVEKGENEMQTAVREAEEEAGLGGGLTFVPGFRERITYFYTADGKRMHKEVIYFLAECPASMAEQVKLSREHTEYAWLSYDEAMKMLTYENDRKILERAEKLLGILGKK